MGQTQPPPLRHSADAACLGTQFCHKCSNYVTVAINVTGKIREAHVRVGTVEVTNTVAEYNAVFKRSALFVAFAIDVFNGNAKTSAEDAPTLGLIAM